MEELLRHMLPDYTNSPAVRVHAKMKLVTSAKEGKKTLTTSPRFWGFQMKVLLTMYSSSSLATTSSSSPGTSHSAASSACKYVVAFNT